MILPSPPGDTISDIIDERKLSYFEIAKALGISQDDLKKLLKGNLPIDSDLAIRLAVNLGSTKEFWEAREKNYRMAKGGVVNGELFSYTGAYKMYISEGKLIVTGRERFKNFKAVFPLSEVGAFLKQQEE